MATGASAGIPPSTTSPEVPSMASVSDSSPSSASSGNESSTWATAGVYVPVHRRSGSSTSTFGTAAQSSARSPPKAQGPRSQPKPKSKQQRQRQRQRQPGPAPEPAPETKPRTYSRTHLLSLAPSSLIYASLRPIVSPALLAAYPRILRARGDGVARALSMARSDPDSDSSLSSPLSSPPVPPVLHGGEYFAYRIGAESKTTTMPTTTTVMGLKKSRAARMQMPMHSTLPLPPMPVLSLPPAPALVPGPGTQPQTTERRRRDRRRPRTARRNRNRNTSLAAVPVPGRTTDGASDNKLNDLTTQLPPQPPIRQNTNNLASTYLSFKHTPGTGTGSRQLALDVMRTATWRPQPPQLQPPPAPQAVAA